MWIELARSFTPNCIFSPPVTADAIAEAQRALEIEFPSSLRELLLETDGLAVRIAFGEVLSEDESYDFLWPLAEIVETNLRLRDESLGFDLKDSLLLFASAPNGDYFGFSVSEGVAEDESLYGLSHEDSEIAEIVSPLRELVGAYLGHIRTLESTADGG